MSLEDAEATIRKVHEAVNRGDREAFVALWTEECEYQPAIERQTGEEGTFRGHDGIRRWWQAMSDAWSEWSTEVNEIRDAGGDQVFISLTLHATGRLSGAATEASIFQLVTIRAGKAVTSRDFSDRKQALEAAGLQEG